MQSVLYWIRAERVIFASTPTGDIGQNPAIPPADQSYTCIEKAAVVFSMILIVMTFPISLFFCYKVVAEFERVVLLRMGKLR